jgi:arylsulfatase A-like enzyme
MVILAADNGMAWGAHHWHTKFAPYATPIPLFVHWPARLGTRPATVRTTVSNVDIAPTLCAIAGCQMGPFPNGFGVDGISFLKVLLAKGGRLGREVVFEEHPSEVDGAEMPGWKGVRTTDESPIGRWVYTSYRTGEEELYDLSGGPCWTWQAGDPGDPCALQNRAGDPAVATVQAALRAVLARREQHPMRIAP